MSAIAMILVKRGYSVSGSDTQLTEKTVQLSKSGITIFKDQSSENIEFLCKKEHYSPIIIVSSAIQNNNEELKAAHNKKLHIQHRSDLLASLINNQKSIVVAGSHGKTTTSTLITTLLALCDEDPTAVIGGVVPLYKTNGHSGKGDLLIAEADESDGTLIKFKSYIGLITNLELDHTDHYKNMNSLIKTIEEFGNKCKHLIINQDCNILKESFKSNVITCSIKSIKNTDFAAIPTSMSGNQSIAKYYEKNKLIGEIIIPLPGLHNLSNVIMGIAACRTAGISFNKLNKQFNKLRSPSRRFEFKGIWNERLIIDDYAHHPSEIKATLEVGRLQINSPDSFLPKKVARLIVVFQPHRFSRTQDLMNEFSKSLGNSDLLFLAPIYSAGERAINGINSESLANLVKNRHPNLPVYSCKTLSDIEIELLKRTQANDLILFIGAGNINSFSKKLMENKELEHSSEKI